VAEEENELEGVPAPGDVIVEKYRVDRVLGVGGMGCVVAATHLSLHQPVAIKFLLAKVAQNPKHVMRFQREAQAAARIKSDHVAKVSDVGTMPNGTPYMVMEFLEGEDLAGRLRRGPVPVGEAVDYLLQGCEALAEAHYLGIVHRDLKPANLFLARHSDGFARVKVLDFGISKITAAPGQGADLTKTSALMGSPLYMSPEQMMSAKAADSRTDIWALGCILFEALTCQPPFIGETLPEICSRILAHPPTSLRSLLPTAPMELEALVGKTLAKEPTLRFQNLGELAEALVPFATPRGLRSVNVIRRMLGQPELDLGVTTSPGSHSLSASMPQQHHSYPPPPTGVSVSQSGPHRQFGVVTPIPGSTSDPFGASVPIVPPVGVATHAPVAQTMSGERRRSRAPLFVMAAMVVLGGIGAGLFFGFRSNANSEAAESASSEPTAAEHAADSPPEPAPATEIDRHGIEETSKPEPPTKSSPTKSTAPPTPPPPPPVAPAPKAPFPLPPPSPKTPEVRPGDDKFNTLKP